MEESESDTNVESNPSPPMELLDWLKDRGVKEGAWVTTTTLHGMDENLHRSFLLTSVPLNELNFNNPHFNPRDPNFSTIKQLSSSIAQLTLLSPLTCVFLEGKERPPADKINLEEKDDEVYLIDGRHRFEALKLLQKSKNEKYAEEVYVDLKIFFNIKRSEVHLIANYLNRSRRKLKPAEYYESVSKIYDETVSELIEKSTEIGYQPTEKEVFDAIPNEKLKDRNIDLSIGRIVGIIAFDEEDKGSWYGYVGKDQNERISLDNEHNGKYKPLTAGILFHLLKPLCYPMAYDDYGERRVIEIENCVELGRHYRSHVMVNPAIERSTSTATSVACKTYVSMAFGELLRDLILSSFGEDDKKKYANSVFSKLDLDWKFIDKILDTFFEIMGKQADEINKCRFSGNLTSLQNAWSFQTQKKQVLSGLIREFKKLDFDLKDYEE